MTDNGKRIPTREAMAMREVGATSISPGTALGLTWVFLLGIVLVPLMQHVGELRGNRLPQAYDIFRALPTAARTFSGGEGGFARRLLAANAALLEEINDYEDEIEQSSVLSTTLLGPTQLFMLKTLGKGNEKAYPGQNGWLYFRPDVDYATGPRFLHKRTLSARRLSGNEYTSAPQPDPRLAIAEFNEQLSRRGILLVVVPTPVKPEIHPEFFSTRYGQGDAPVHNKSYSNLLRDLQREGVLVLDAAETLKRAIEFSGLPQYLEADTHWKPGAMEAVARQAAHLLNEKVAFTSENREYVQAPMDVQALGDIARMLKLPADQELFLPQSVSIRQVRDARTGGMWRPSRSAEVLLLGDSFSNIYSLPNMGWGQAAGFGEQISFYLQRPVDVIIQNDSGAFATRQAIYARQSRGDDPLLGKKVVIWQFATRELALGDWKLFVDSGAADFSKHWKK